MPWLEQARQLLRKARQDAVIVERAIQDTEISDEIVGFHTQQAAEKCFKAILCLHEIVYRRTHDLQELYDLLQDSRILVPDTVALLVDWSPFAVVYRYEDWVDLEAVNRELAVTLVKTAIKWTTLSISEALALHDEQEDQAAA